MITRFWDWIDRRGVVRRWVLFFTLWMTYRVTDWAFAYAHDALGHGGFEVSTTIAAITAPFAALQAFVFKWYLDSRGNDAKPN